jgi:hypothetical protein
VDRRVITSLAPFYHGINEAGTIFYIPFQSPAPSFLLSYLSSLRNISLLRVTVGGDFLLQLSSVSKLSVKLSSKVSSPILLFFQNAL